MVWTWNGTHGRVWEGGTRIRLKALTFRRMDRRVTSRRYRMSTRIAVDHCASLVLRRPQCGYLLLFGLILCCTPTTFRSRKRLFISASRSSSSDLIVNFAETEPDWNGRSGRGCCLLAELGWLVRLRSQSEHRLLNFILRSHLPGVYLLLCCRL